MDIKPTFITRQNTRTNNPSTFDAAKIIKYYLALHPSNRLIVNSPLYLAAVEQYNQQIKNTLIRPPIPDWFCGKINPTTNELIPLPTDQEQRAANGVLNDNPITTTPIPPQDPKNYLQDSCLSTGTPGSAEYLRCNSSALQDEDNRDVGGLGWQPTNGGTSTCSIYLARYFDTVSRGLVVAGWGKTKDVIRNQGLGGDLTIFDNYYNTGDTSTVDSGPMSGSGKSCQTVDETTTRINWVFTWGWKNRSGTVRASVNVSNENGSTGTFTAEEI